MTETLTAFLMLEMSKRIRGNSDVAQTSENPSRRGSDAAPMNNVTSKCLFCLIQILGGVSKQLLNALAPGVNFKQSLKTNQNQQSNITRILLTGGPCAGKTTAITNISKSLG